jgi:hypothetical protein
MARHALRKDNVVDLARYRARRAQRELPLEGPPASRVEPAPPLSARAIEHRERMLHHLNTTSRAGAFRRRQS